MVLRLRFMAVLSFGSTGILSSGLLLVRARRALLIPFVVGEFVMPDFLRKELLSKTTGEPLLEEADRCMDWLLMVRSKGRGRAGTYVTSGIFTSSSGKRGNHAFVLSINGSAWNIGEHSTLSM